MMDFGTSKNVAGRRDSGGLQSCESQNPFLIRVKHNFFSPSSNYQFKIKLLSEILNFYIQKIKKTGNLSNHGEKFPSFFVLVPKMITFGTVSMVIFSIPKINIFWTIYHGKKLYFWYAWRKKLLTHALYIFYPAHHT